jgi:hypothetical protein
MTQGIFCRHPLGVGIITLTPAANTCKFSLHVITVAGFQQYKPLWGVKEIGKEKKNATKCGV